MRLSPAITFVVVAHSESVITNFVCMVIFQLFKRQLPVKLKEIEADANVVVVRPRGHLSSFPLRLAVSGLRL